jgi:hypothetical protein
MKKPLQGHNSVDNMSLLIVLCVNNDINGCIGNEYTTKFYVHTFL